MNALVVYRLVSSALTGINVVRRVSGHYERGVLAGFAMSESDMADTTPPLPVGFSIGLQDF